MESTTIDYETERNCDVTKVNDVNIRSGTLIH